MQDYNLGKVSSRKLIAEGTYPAIIVEVKSRKTKKDIEMKQVVFELPGGQRVSDFIVVMEQTYWKLQNLFRACGLPYEGVVHMSDNWDELIGISLEINVGVEEYDGNKRNKISYPIEEKEEKKSKKK